MSKIKTLRSIINDKNHIGPILANKIGHNWFFRLLPDALYLKLMYRFCLGRKLNLKNPRGYNEKLQWLKINDRNPRYSIMVDKYEVKKYIGSILGEEYVIPVYGVWDSFDQIDFSKLPNEFVLKTTHDSGGVIICRNKMDFDIFAAEKKLEASLNRNFFYYGREWPYKSLKPRIIAEKLLVDESGKELRDYKVLCFEGKAKLIEFHKGRYTNHQSQDYYDITWNKLPITQGSSKRYKPTEKTDPKPSTLEEMIRFSEVLSRGLHHVRVDWYSVCGKLYFGELTFYDGSGFVPYDDYKYDLLLGSWINIK